VYYIGADGKRHAFPNARIFSSWYADFNGVRVIPSAQMASIPLGINARYKPGDRLIKFNTDSKVYAISKGGVLRWVKTEAIAAALYGSQWNKNVDDLSDTFYGDYTLGTDVNAASDFSASSQEASVVTIGDDYGM